MENSGNALIDFGRFLTGFLVVMGVGMFLPSPTRPHHLHIPTASGESLTTFSGETTDLLSMVLIALPALLAHCALIQYPAMVMSIVGGLLIYGTIISFTTFFHEEQEF